MDATSIEAVGVKLVKTEGPRALGKIVQLAEMMDEAATIADGLTDLRRRSGAIDPATITRAESEALQSEAIALEIKMAALRGRTTTILGPLADEFWAAVDAEEKAPRHERRRQRRQRP